MTEDTFLNRRAALAKLALIGAVAFAGAVPALADDDGGSDDAGGDNGNDDNGNDDNGSDDNDDSAGNGNDDGPDHDSGDDDSGSDKPKNLMDLLRGKNRRRKHG